MSDKILREKIDDIYEDLKNVSHDAQAKLLAKIKDEIEQFIRQENESAYSTGSSFDLLSKLTESVQDVFEELLDAHRDKKIYDSAIKIFALLLNKNVNSIEKIKRITKIAIETTLKLWQGPKQR